MIRLHDRATVGPRAHILLTNDDGYTGEGLRVLRIGLIRAGFRVTVVAPASDMSGIGRALTFRVPVVVRQHDEERHHGYREENRVFSCVGTPVDCVRVALLSDMIDPIDLVVSGINHGVNLGDDVTSSGTVGAALEGVLLGVPAVAVSQQDDAGDVSMLSHGAHHFLLTYIAVQACQLVSLRPPPPRMAISINLPHGVKNPVVKKARISSFSYARSWTPSEALDTNLWSVWAFAKPGAAGPSVDTSAGTDYAALKDNSVSVSVLRADWDALSQTPSGTRKWLDNFVRELGAAVSGGAAGPSRQRNP